MQDWEDWELDWKTRKPENVLHDGTNKGQKKKGEITRKTSFKKKSIDPTYFYYFIVCFCVIKIRGIKADEQSPIPTIIPIIEFTSIADTMMHFKMLHHLLKAF